MLTKLASVELWISEIALDKTIFNVCNIKL